MESLTLCISLFAQKIGSFFMINLCLVVIATQFSETKQREHQLMQEQRAQAHSSSTLASMTEPSAGCYESVFQLVCHVLRKARRYGVWRLIHAKIHLNIYISVIDLIWCNVLLNMRMSSRNN